MTSLDLTGQVLTLMEVIALVAFALGMIDIFVHVFFGEVARASVVMCLMVLVTLSLKPWLMGSCSTANSMPLLLYGYLLLVSTSGAWLLSRRMRKET